MAAMPYEPVFAIVGRAIGDAADRLRAIATVTVFGGLASSVFLPVTAWLVERYGWHRAVYVLASVLALASVVVYRFALVDLEFRAQASEPSTINAASLATDPQLRSLVLTFACSSFAGVALATNLVPALIDRGLSTTTAATFAGLFGVMQLPRRLLIMNGRFELSPRQMIWSSLGLQVVGLAALVPATSSILIATGVTLFACGSGLATLARPYLVLVLYGAGRAGHINGVIARWQQLARAGGPIAVAAIGVVHRLWLGVRAARALASHRRRHASRLSLRDAAA